MTGFQASKIRFLPYHQNNPSQPAVGLGNIVVIPARREPEIEKTIASLAACHPPHHDVEVLVIINASRKDPKSTITINRDTFAQLTEISRIPGRFSFHLTPLLYEDLPEKIAGAGLARRLGFDEAARRFSLCSNPHGVITSLDADTLVEPGYLQALEKAFSDGKTDIATLYFEHPVSGDTLPSRAYYGIVRYELHLRYFVQALRFSGYPWGYHTVGSAFAVKSSSYVKQGGMNLRKAGEDFYFLQKMFKSGRTKEITSTCVYPSSRPSDRVPFGTGPEIMRFIQDGNKELMTYSLDAFVDLHTFFQSVNTLYKMPEREYPGYFSGLPVSLQFFLGEEALREKINEIGNNVGTLKAFVKRFYRWFDAFRVIKFLNLTHDGTYYSKLPVVTQARTLLEHLGGPVPADPVALLEQCRLFDRNRGE